MEHSKWMKELDYFFNKVLPKKFIVMVIATIFCFLGIVSGGQWLIVAGAYAGITYAQKLTTKGILNDRNDYNTSRGGGDCDSSSGGLHLDAEKSREETNSNGE